MLDVVWCTEWPPTPSKYAKNKWPLRKQTVSVTTMKTHFRDISWTAFFSFVKVHVAFLCPSRFSTVSVQWNISARILNLYGKGRLGWAGSTREWNLSNAGAFLWLKTGVQKIDTSLVSDDPPVWVEDACFVWGGGGGGGGDKLDNKFNNKLIRHLYMVVYDCMWLYGCIYLLILCILACTGLTKILHEL